MYFISPLSHMPTRFVTPKRLIVNIRLLYRSIEYSTLLCIVGGKTHPCPGIAYRPLLSRSFTPSFTSNTATNERSTTPARYFSRSSGGSDKSKKQKPFESVLWARFLQSV